MNHKIMPPTYFIILFLLAIISHFVFPIKGISSYPVYLFRDYSNYLWAHNGYLG